LGHSFVLGRSVRQGCPLAPYLYLFFAEAFSGFLCSQIPPLCGLRLPLPVGDQDELLDSEYANDTLLFLDFSFEALDWVRTLLDCFYLATRARVNWNKSSGLLIGTEELYSWGETDGFTWLHPGETCTYLGFQIGLDVSPTQ